jgi:murein DD-endopeptidase MepM/ murein hydrolase activator NlpD
MRKVPALKAVFAKLFRLSAEKDYLLHIHWKSKHRSIARPLSPTLIRVLTGVFGFFLLGLACLVWEAGYWAVKELRYHYAAATHGTRLGELREIQSDLKAIEGTLESAFQQEQRMRALYGVNYLGASQSGFGVGGRSYPTERDSMLSQGLYESLFHAQLKGRQLRGKIDYTLRNFIQIQEFVDYRHHVWEHTPSVTPAPGNWTSGFGYRVHPVSGRYTAHKGLDISGSRFTPIRATAAGRVEVSSMDRGGYGNLVVLNHGNGYYTKYGHMSRILVRPGQRVKRFELLGYMGSTGVSTGVHVHYEVLRGKEHIDPERFILPTGLVVD